jgi:tryptophan 7-halogenase
MLDHQEYESWQHWFPCDRIIAVSSPALNPAPSFSQVSAFAKGWLGFFPLQDRTAVSAVYSSKYAGVNEILQNLQAIPGIRLGSVTEKSFTVGVRKNQWIGNCISLGSAGTSLDPLDATHMHMLDLGLSLLRALFPVDKNNLREAAVFNEKMYSHAINLRDFQIAHYKLNKRYGEPMWDEVRAVEPPSTLARKIKLFEARGRVAMQEYETFQEESWTSIFIGHGIQPATYDPLVDNMPEQEQIEHFQKILKYIADEVQSMPSLQAYIEMNA